MLRYAVEQHGFSENKGDGGCINRPAMGWIHPDQFIFKGVTYAVRYIGCLEINTSMKSLDFDQRSQVAKECMNRVCEAASLKTVDKKRKVDKKVLRAIGDIPNMEHAGVNVELTISVASLTLTMLESRQVIAKHDLPRISFASGGDTDTLDFVAYVAKDLSDWRACYVLECGGELAQDVIYTIGQAFEIRFKEFLTPPSNPISTSFEYYNDLPGKVPPESGPPPVPPLPNLPTSHSTRAKQIAKTNQQSVGICAGASAEVAAGSSHKEQSRESVSSNLIDLNCEVAPPTPPTSAPRREHNYVNDMIQVSKDPFDMQPFSTAVPHSIQLQKEPWFHGSVSRHEAESLLTKDGDFLVRESQGSPGQYVLTGLQGFVKKHLLLVDPEGVVRTKDRMFESVSHLINYHCENELPIISAESALVLRRPILRKL